MSAAEFRTIRPAVSANDDIHRKRQEGKKKRKSFDFISFHFLK